MITSLIKRFTYAVSGILIALKTDKSYRQQFFGAGLAIIIFMFIVWPLEKIDILFLGLAYVLILITELQNSSFETALDRIHPDIHDEIGKSKDMAAGAVLTAGFFLVFVLIVVAFF